jgi:hypothetical protein
MAIAVQLDFPGGTLAQYDQVIQKMGFRPGGSGSPGLLFHWVTKTANGNRVTDVWTSKDAFEKFSREQIGPYSQQVGLAAPTIQFFEIHNHLTAG